MANISKAALMTVISSLGFASVSATVAVTAISQNPQLRLFRNNESSWIITKEDLESEEDTFSKVTTKGNIIEFLKTDNSVINLTPLTGLESVTLQSANSYLQVSTGFNEDSFLYERYFKNDGTNEFNISLIGECFLQISSMDEVLDADDIDISYTCSMSTEEIYDPNLEYIFDSVTSSYSVKVNSSVTKSKVISVDIPKYFDDGVNGKHYVTTIGYEAFFNCLNLKWISIPSSINKIEERAFNQCYNLNDLYIPDGPTTILNRTFHRCYRLSNLRLPETLISLGEYPFYYANGLTSLHLPNSITSIASNCFSQCENLYEVNCPTSLTTIPSSFIYSAPKLKSLTIGRNITRINDSAFKGLTDFTLYYEGTSAEWDLVNKSVTGRYFNGCTNAQVVILGD